MTKGAESADLAALVERVRDAVRDEYGSVLCAWIDMGTKRCCAINVPPYKCRCDAVARAAIEATGILAERQAREEAERQLAEADSVIEWWLRGGPSREAYGEHRMKWEAEAVARHASRSDDRRDTP